MFPPLFAAAAAALAAVLGDGGFPLGVVVVPGVFMLLLLELLTNY